MMLVIAVEEWTVFFFPLQTIPSSNDSIEYGRREQKGT